MTVSIHKNSSDGGWIVQKYGGTSVGKFADKVAEEIVRPNLANNKLIVVCSARSSDNALTQFWIASGRLLEVFKKLRALSSHLAAEQSQCDLISEAKEIIQSVCDEHVEAVKYVIQDPNMVEELSKEIQTECQELTEYIMATKRFHLEVNSRSKDRVASFGEKLSCRFMTALLRDRGVEAEYVDLSETLHIEVANRLDATFYHNAIDKFRARLEACEDRVPVVTGFFGNVPNGLLDGDIGRGYTDLCAALCAVAVKADELQVWKEVEGIFTADPTKVPTARLLSSITPSEAAELTFYGSEVIHHLTMDQVIHAKPPIPIRIKNVKNPRGRGTIVVPDPDLAPTSQIERTRRTEDVSVKRTPKRPTAVTVKDNVFVINIHSNKRSISHGFFAKIFSILDAHHISVDLISTSEVHVSMAIHSASSTASFEKAEQELAECGDVSILHDMAILSLVGAEMKNMIGVAGKMFSTLGEYNVNIEMISQGASEINISCVIDERDATRAMNILHTNLFTFLE
ncbi:hypothetical protein MKZ38_005265 [Zalerion maritima]|uniref:Aspartokinase n=1 Tax=Zalerion maritima TaxID=339359 RepID=A0AAD5RKY0_9PEZI|nr:hypothetical protein MKZ38_005265 [Zalerion maritima]